jgi:hypothetical protein
MRSFHWLVLGITALPIACADLTPVALDLNPVDEVESALAGTRSAGFPSSIPLPNGFQPEGIAIGSGTTFFVGSLAGPYMGSIYRGDLRTGAGSMLVAAEPGTRQAVGLAYDSRSNRLYVAGGMLSVLDVYDADSGAHLGGYSVPGLGLSNDVVVTRDAVYLTDSFRPVLYRLGLGPAGRLPVAAAIQELPLGGEYVFDPDVPFGINNNGIVATPDGRYLIVVNYGTGVLYRVDARTGHAKRIEIGAELLNTDGLVLMGRTLYAVQNFFNQITVITLAPDLGSGTVARTIADAAFRIPTTADVFGSSLYVVNARFDVASPFEPGDYSAIDFDVVRVAR